MLRSDPPLIDMRSILRGFGGRLTMDRNAALTDHQLPAGAGARREDQPGIDLILSNDDHWC